MTGVDFMISELARVNDVRIDMDSTNDEKNADTKSTNDHIQTCNIK